MNILFTKAFDAEFEALSRPLQEKSRKTLDTFLRCYESRRFPKGLRIHKCGPFLSLSVTMQYRIFVLPVEGGLSFVFIGSHNDADRYLKK
ncbi:MAG: hypothetical protein BWY42_01801 [Candidatus Omnitrophica bacterium ADurb.Bin277]|nr:MAG: hypothetical protein BWY42_01801 [Candidatus Omnitrophica bacterium ADurb.Bin277]